MRRDALGGKRGRGHRYQALGRRVRRADPTRIHPGGPDPSLTGFAGLVDFAVFARQQGLDRELSRRFSALKPVPRVVYPMGSQLRLLVDANVTSETRIFGLEALSADPLMAHLADGFLPSLDTVSGTVRRRTARQESIGASSPAEQGPRQRDFSPGVVQRRRPLAG